jgi:hypothetical protein
MRVLGTTDTVRQLKLKLQMREIQWKKESSKEVDGSKNEGKEADNKTILN